jgi:hypothetical protein
MWNLPASQIWICKRSENDDIPAISHMAQISLGTLCAKCSIADFDVRIGPSGKLSVEK